MLYQRQVCPGAPRPPKAVSSLSLCPRSPKASAPFEFLVAIESAFIRVIRG